VLRGHSINSSSTCWEAVKYVMGIFIFLLVRLVSPMRKPRLNDCSVCYQPARLGDAAICCETRRDATHHVKRLTNIANSLINTVLLTGLLKTYTPQRNMQELASLLHTFVWTTQSKGYTTWQNILNMLLYTVNMQTVHCSERNLDYSYDVIY